MFARVMERFFAPYAPSNSFVQLIIGSSNGSHSHSGAVLWRGEQVDQISDPTIRELATAWVKSPKLSPEVIAFFDHFVHNTITIANNVSLGDGVFMQLRTIDDAGTLGRIERKASSSAKTAAGHIGKALSALPPDYPTVY